MGGEAQVEHNPRHVTEKTYRRKRPERKEYCWEKIVGWKEF